MCRVRIGHGWRGGWLLLAWRMLWRLLEASEHLLLDGRKAVIRVWLVGMWCVRYHWRLVVHGLYCVRIRLWVAWRIHGPLESGGRLGLFTSQLQIHVSQLDASLLCPQGVLCSLFLYASNAKCKMTLCSV